MAKMNNWKNITNYFFKCLFSSGLYDVCDEIKIGCVGEEEFTKYDLDFLLNFSKIKIYKLGNLSCFEIETLKLLYKDCCSKNFNLFYFHTKGASLSLESWKKNKDILKKQYHIRNYMKFEDVKKAYRCTRYWTKYFLINNYKNCLNLLNNSDIVCLKRSHNDKFIPINFWWSKSDYIRTLPFPEMTKDRYDAEMWVCKNKQKKITSFLGRVDEYKKVKFL